MDHIAEVLNSRQNTRRPHMTESWKKVLSTGNDSPGIYDRLKVNQLYTFENFRELPGTELALRSIKKVIEGHRPIVLIYGGVGNGKTHLLHAAAIELFNRGYFARVYLYADMLNTLKKSINSESNNYGEILDRYCFAERLIIDDIGAAGTDTEFSDRILENIICTRYGRELLTIMSTNRDINSFPERVVSRLKDKVVCFLVENTGRDYRPLRGN